MDNSDFEHVLEKLSSAASDLQMAFYAAESDYVLAGMISEATSRLCYIKGYAQGQLNSQKEAEAIDANA